jgi:helicase MOV-10
VPEGVSTVEAIKQVLASNPYAKILACAPSNSAADLIATRLVKTRSNPGLTVDELFRLYAPSRSKDQVPDDLKDFTHSTPDGHLSVPKMARLSRFRVILTTCVSASILQGVGMPRGHFSSIFIDEAGQATEPETFVSIKLMADSKTNIAETHPWSPCCVHINI